MAEEKLAELYVEVKAKTDKLEKDLNKLKSQSTKATGEMSKGFGGVSKSTIAWGAVLTGVLAIVKKSITEFSAQQQAQAKLKTQLGYTSKALLDQASALQKVSIYGDDVIINTQSAISAFTKNEDQIKALTKASLDYAAGTGTDLITAAQLIAKSFGSSTNALKRYGVEVEGTAGSSERLQQITDGITKLWGGQAQSAANTFAGKIAQLQNKIGDFLENLGGPFIDVLTRWINKLSDIIPEQKNVSDEFITLNSNVKTLTKDISPLLTEYDKLKEKASLNKTEQNRLKIIIEKIAEVIPSAVTEYDKYGKALGINTEKAKQFILTQQALLQIKNKEVIKETADEIQQYSRYLTTANAVIKDFEKTDISTKTQDEINTFTDAQKSAAEYTNRIQTLTLALAALKGEDIEEYIKLLNSLDESGSGGSGGGGGNGDDKLNYYEQLAEDLKKLQDELATNLKIENATNLELDRRIQLLKAIVELERKSTENIFGIGLTPRGLETGIGIGEKASQEQIGFVPVPEKPIAFEGAEESVDNMAQKFGSIINMSTTIGSILNVAGDSFVGKLIQGFNTITQLANSVLGIISAFSGGVGGGIFSLFGHKGGVFEGGKQVAKFSGGTSGFNVPSGFPNDSFPMLVESGERVKVTPSGRVGEESKFLAEILGAIKGQTKTQIELSRNNKGEMIINIDEKGRAKNVTHNQNRLKKSGFNLNEL